MASSIEIATEQAFVSPTLFIGYAQAYCTEDQVLGVFNSVLDEDIVDTVKSCEKTNYKNGSPFKLFFITFKKMSPNLLSLLARIQTEEHVKIEYDGKWFWKVIINGQKPEIKVKPRIMERGEIKTER